MPAGRGIFRLSSQPTTGSRPRAMKSAATIQRSKLRGVGTDPVDQQGQPHAHGAHKAHVEGVLRRHPRTGTAKLGALQPSLVLGGLVPAAEYSGGISKRSRGWAPGSGWRSRRTTWPRAAAAAPLRRAGAGLLAARPLCQRCRVDFRVPRRIRPSCQSLVFGACSVRGAASAGRCDDHRKHYQQPCQQPAEGRRATGLEPAPEPRPPTGLVVTKRLLLKVNPR